MRTRTGHAAPPADGSAAPPVDEGPMRRELLRQIALLDAELSARRMGPGAERATPVRGPALQPTHVLETIRDELLQALSKT